MKVNSNIFILQTIFIKGFVIIYLSAFSSWFYQISALFGKDGITPLNVWIQNMYKGGSKVQKFYEIPSLLIFSEEIINYLQQYFPQFEVKDLDAYETVFYIICILGSFLSILVVLDLKNKIFVGWYTQFLLYFLYLSVYYTGQNFSSFQWDILLVEVGFVSIFFVPQKYNNEISKASMYILRFIGFKLFYSSGVLKFSSKCPTWWQLTALNYHFWSQPLPNQLSWFFNIIPIQIKKLMVAGNFICLIFGSILFYSPFKFLRQFGGLLNILMQVNIILSGNYNFFNFLSILLCFTTFDDQFILKYFPNFVLKCFGIFQNNITNINQKNQDDQKIKILIQILQMLFCVASVFFIFLYFFGINSIFDDQTKLKFTYQDVEIYLVNGYILYVIIGIFAFQLINSVSINDQNQNKQWLILKYGKKYLAIIIGLLLYLLNINSLFQGINSQANPIGYLFNTQNAEFLNRKLQLSHSYGLFRRMTGIQGREELIFEGSLDGKDWQEFEFIYKPGNDLSVLPPLATPHQPRIDWQLWFTAMRKEIQEPYMIGIIQKLFKNSPSFMTQLKKNPFQDNPVKYIRILKYQYEFTNLEEYKNSGNWWKRKGRKVFLYPISKDSNQLTKQYLQMQIEKLSTDNIPLHPLYYTPLLEIIITIFLMHIIRVLFTKEKLKQINK